MTKVTQLLAAAAIVTVSATTAFAQTKGTITAVEEEGRGITVKADDGKEAKVTVSGSRTTITIKGAAGDRTALKTGLVCTVTPDSGEAATIACD
jgi:hypothetical protein